MQCPKCKSSTYTKCGKVKGIQRYKCKGCKCQFTRSTPLGESDKTKEFALKLYLEGIGFRAIGRLLDVSNVAVLKWIRKFGNRAELLHKEALGKIQKVSTIEIDEMHHYIGKKTKKSGCGWLLIEVPKPYWGQSSAIVVEKHSES